MLTSDAPVLIAAWELRTRRRFRRLCQARGPFLVARSAGPDADRDDGWDHGTPTTRSLHLHCAFTSTTGLTDYQTVTITVAAQARLPTSASRQRSGDDRDRHAVRVHDQRLEPRSRGGDQCRPPRHAAGGARSSAPRLRRALHSRQRSGELHARHSGGGGTATIFVTFNPNRGRAPDSALVSADQADPVTTNTQPSPRHRRRQPSRLARPSVSRFRPASSQETST